MEIRIIYWMTILCMTLIALGVLQDGAGAHRYIRRLGAIVISGRKPSFNILRKRKKLTIGWSPHFAQMGVIILT